MPTPAALVLAASLVLVSPAAGAERTFTGAVSASWSDARNWSGGAVPGARDHARIGTGLRAEVSGEIAARVARLTVGRGAAVAGGFAPLTVTGRVVLEERGALTYARLEPGALLHARGAATLSRISGSGRIVADGDLRALPLTFDGPVTLRGRSAVLDGRAGSLRLAGRGTTVDVPFGLDLGRRLLVPRGASLRLDRSATLRVPLLRIAHGGSVSTESETGSIVGDVLSSGRLRIGYTRAGGAGERRLHVLGSFRQTRSGELVAGAGRAFGGDGERLPVLEVARTARLGGTARVRGLERLTDALTIVRARRIAGRFDRLRGVPRAGLVRAAAGREVRVARRMP